MPALTLPPSIARTTTGLDQVLTALALDPGLTTALMSARQASKEAATLEGIAAAAALNQLIVEAVNATGVARDGLLSADDIVAVNRFIRADAERLSRFTAAHGDDANGVETGYHLIQGNGGVLQFDGLNFANRVMDGIYHIGFTIENGRFVNEDGDANVRVDEVASWLNFLLLGSNAVVGTAGNDTYTAGPSDAIFANADIDIVRMGAGNDRVRASAGNDVLYGEDGDDALAGDAGDDLVVGGAGNDSLEAGLGRDTLDGGAGRDLLRLEADGTPDLVIIRPGDTGRAIGTADVIAGFEAGIDKLDLRGFAGLAFSTSANFSGRGPEVLFVANRLLIDVDGDRQLDALISFQGLTAITANDLILG